MPLVRLPSLRVPVCSRDGRDWKGIEFFKVLLGGDRTLAATIRTIHVSILQGLVYDGSTSRLMVRGRRSIATKPTDQGTEEHQSGETLQDLNQGFIRLVGRRRHVQETQRERNLMLKAVLLFQGDPEAQKVSARCNLARFVLRSEGLEAAVLHLDSTH